MQFTAKQFAKLLFPMLGLCIGSVAVLASFSVVDGMDLPDLHKNYYLALDAKEAELESNLKNNPKVPQEAMKQLALVLWQNNKIENAEPYLRELWLEHNSTNTTTYDQTFVQDGLNLAGLYLDRGSNGLAATIYERLIAYDTAHLPPTDARLGRDYNNLGLCYLQTGEALEKWEDRKSWFEKANEQYSKAEKIFRSSPQSSQQLICSLQNQIVAYSELNDDQKALALGDVVNKQLDAWNENRDKLQPAAHATSEKRI